MAGDLPIGAGLCVCVCVHMHEEGNIFWDSDNTPDDGDVNKQYYTLPTQLFIKVVLAMCSTAYHYR